MGLFDKLKEPVFLKETSVAKEQLEQLKLLLTSVPDDIKSHVEQEIKILTYGIYGEDNIAFELKNSHMPMYILHDIFLEDNGLTAQIDFLIITRKRIFVIECKNMIGNIEINNNGEFIRTVEFYGKYKKEGIYSPITQNQRHMELLKQLRAKAKGNFLTKALFEKNFYNTYRSVVVLANPKTLLNSKYAKKEVKENVIRADQIIEYIKRENNDPTFIFILIRIWKKWLNFFLGYIPKTQLIILKNTKIYLKIKKSWLSNNNKVKNLHKLIQILRFI
jgi:hypothetical protein